MALTEEGTETQRSEGMGSPAKGPQAYFLVIFCFGGGHDGEVSGDSLAPMPHLPTGIVTPAESLLSSQGERSKEKWGAPPRWFPYDLFRKQCEAPGMSCEGIHRRRSLP